MEKMIIIGEPDKLTPELRAELIAKFSRLEVEFKSPEDIPLSDMIPAPMILAEPISVPPIFIPPLTRRERRANRRNNKL